MFMNEATKNTTGLLVKEDGTLEEVVLNTTDTGSNLDEMKRLLDVRVVECVGLPQELDCWVDEEFLLVAEPVPNLVLSVMLSLMDSTNHYICGSGLFLAVDNRTGASVSLNAEQRNRVETAHHMASKATGNGEFPVTVVD
ncbi:hypothetical protein CH252_04925 [Rhodococcus sp. 06-1477-1B]|nr:hypothetical protein CH252_04925 [Rhodococcus sp. 06-1477-1B]